MQNCMKLIRDKVGHGNVKSWIQNEFGMPYRSFIYQVREETMRYRDLVKLLNMLELKFEDLKQEVFAPEKKAEKKEEQKKIKKAEKVLEREMKPKKLSELFGAK